MSKGYEEPVHRDQHTHVMWNLIQNVNEKHPGQEVSLFTVAKSRMFALTNAMMWYLGFLQRSLEGWVRIGWKRWRNVGSKVRQELIPVKAGK